LRSKVALVAFAFFLVFPSLLLVACCQPYVVATPVSSEYQYPYWRGIETEPLVIGFRNVWFDEKTNTIYLDVFLCPEVGNEGWIVVKWFYGVPETYSMRVSSNLTVVSVEWKEVSEILELRWSDVSNESCMRYFEGKIEEYLSHGGKINNVTYVFEGAFNTSYVIGIDEEGNEIWENRTEYLWVCYVNETLRVMNVTLSSVPKRGNLTITSGSVNGRVAIHLTPRERQILVLPVVESNRNLLAEGLVAIWTSGCVAVAIILRRRKKERD